MPKNRANEMFKLKTEGYTLREIGDIFKISHERVRQLIRKFPNYKLYNPPRTKKGKRIPKICKVCKKNYEIIPSRRSTYCSVKCFRKSFKLKKSITNLNK